jgi:hypothetical protein
MFESNSESQCIYHSHCTVPMGTTTIFIFHGINELVPNLCCNTVQSKT